MSWVWWVVALAVCTAEVSGSCARDAVCTHPTPQHPQDEHTSVPGMDRARGHRCGGEAGDTHHDHPLPAKGHAQSQGQEGCSPPGGQFLVPPELHR